MCELVVRVRNRVPGNYLNINNKLNQEQRDFEVVSECDLDLRQAWSVFSVLFCLFIVFFSNQNCFSFKFRQILFNPCKLIIQRRSLCHSLINSTVMIWWLRQILFQTFYWILSFLETYFQINTSSRLLFHTVVSLWIQRNWTSVVVCEI